MDAHPRKRFISVSSDTPAPKVQAVQEQQLAFSDILTVHLLNALNATEPSQRALFLDDMIARIQWLKQQNQQQAEIPPANARKFTPPGKAPLTSPRQDNKALDPQQLQNTIRQQQTMLSGLSKSITMSTQIPNLPHQSPILSMPMQHAPVVQPPVLTPANVPAPRPAPATTPVPVPNRTPASASAPALAPAQIPAAPMAPAPTSAPAPARAPILTPAPASLAPPTLPVITHTAPPPDPPKKSPVPAPPLPPFVTPKKAEPQVMPPKSTALVSQEVLKTVENTVNGIQEQQKRLVSYISSNHGGNLPNEMLREYLKYPYVLLKENGQVRPHLNPFYHLMPPLLGDPSSQAPPSPNMRLMAPPIPVVSPPRRASTPIPAPPVLVPQVELPMSREQTNNAQKKDSPSPIEKVSPPPHLPRQVGFESAAASPTIKPFEPPTTRKCNQWSVFSMALPLRLICHRCYPMPCRCPQ